MREPHAGVSLCWLGQAGFLLRIGPAVVLVDPYLSDHLALKYRNGRFGHDRMMPAPIRPEELPRVDLVLCTHRHGDHMDPGTLPVLAEQHPRCRFVVPAAERRHAEQLPLPEDRLLFADAGVKLRPLAELPLEVEPMPAAHETPERDERGSYRFLGYGMAIGGLRLYHSGDCVPFPPLPAIVRRFAPRIALLPVNGRDAARREAGVPGNFTPGEAVALCAEAGVPWLVPHHWGLFAFNTADPAVLEALAAERDASGSVPRLLVPDTGMAWQLGAANA
ncbi:MAG: MBL fold metallo-hydrolase [Gluconacetobacter diazotrophicus]|nr:MBL fold metallo-hydrolase [Gluconacetobacter diazotrophicus]